MSAIRKEFEYRLNRMGYNLTNVNLRIPIQALWTVLECTEPSGDADLEEAYKQVFGDINWTSVEHELPNKIKLVLAKGITHSGIALARHISSVGKWHVQPFKSKWYSTRHGITHWAPLECIMVDDSDDAFLACLEELRVTDKLLDERNKVMKAIPPCPVHGHQCVPHALEWIKEQVSRQVVDIARKVVEGPQYIPSHVLDAINTILKHLHDSNIEGMQVFSDDISQQVVMRMDETATITLQYDSDEPDICPKCGRTRKAGVCWGYDCDGGIPFKGDE